MTCGRGFPIRSGRELVGMARVVSFVQPRGRLVDHMAGTKSKDQQPTPKGPNKSAHDKRGPPIGAVDGCTYQTAIPTQGTRSGTRKEGPANDSTCEETPTQTATTMASSQAEPTRSFLTTLTSPSTSPPQIARSETETSQIRNGPTDCAIHVGAEAHDKQATPTPSGT